MTRQEINLVIQSHRSPLPHAWIDTCVSSVRNWSREQGYGYRFLSDELFDCLDAELRDKTKGLPVVASDLARLIQMRRALAEGYHTVVWLDADVLVFNPAGFTLPDSSCAIGREVWIQEDPSGKLKAYVKVHNAFLMFRQGDSFLDFYIDTASRLLSRNTGHIPPQFIGPKLLTALHNVAMLPVLESAGMLSPLLVRDILDRRGDALDLFLARSTAPLAAANLCASSCDSGEVPAAVIEQLVEALLDKKSIPGSVY